MPKHSKKKKPSVRVELRAGGGLHRSEKPGWSAGDTGWWPQKKMPRHPVSPKGVLLILLLDLFKVSKMTNFNYELFKVSKITNLFMTCSKSAKFFKIVFFYLVSMHMYIFLWCSFYG